MVLSRKDARTIYLTGKVPRRPSYVRSSKSPDVMSHRSTHLSDDQMGEAQAQLQHADQQLNLQSQYPNILAEITSILNASPSNPARKALPSCPTRPRRCIRHHRSSTVSAGENHSRKLDLRACNQDRWS
jgi:hypothetical protein